MSVKPNILLIAIDTLRYDHLGCYGYKRNTSPNIDKWLASNGVVMENHFTTTTYTHPAFTSIFTGHHPLYHGVVYQKAKEPLSKDIPTLPEYFKNAGYFTCGLDQLAFCDAVKHFGYGYDIIKGPKDFPPLDDSIGGHRNGLNRVKQLVMEILEQAVSHQPFFMYLHVWDPHRAYNARLQYKDRFLTGNEPDPFNYSTIKKKEEHPEEPKNMDYTIAQYDASIFDCDEALGHLFGKIDSLGLSDMLVALTSDHGEELGEHRIYTRHAGAFDTNLHVPFIIRWSGKLPAGARRDSLTSHVDITPTLLSLAGIKHQNKFSGIELDNVIKGKSENTYEAVFGHTINPDMRRCIRTKKYKFLKQVKGAPREEAWPDRELYNLRNDPGEKNNISLDYPEISDQYEQWLDEWVDSQLKKAGHSDPMVEQSSNITVNRWPLW